MDLPGISREYNGKKKIIDYRPVSTQSSSLRHLSQNLSFLNPYYSIECLDPLVTLQECPDEEYYGIWQNQLKPLIKIYDAFVGFSFGGVILQQCFSILSEEKKTNHSFFHTNICRFHLKRKT